MKEVYALELDDGSGELVFEWDSEKAATNLKKHGIRFEEAVEIFQDSVLTLEDTSEAYGEIRELSFGRIGTTPKSITIVCVVHTDREERIRVIGARKATASERKHFDEHYRKTCH